MVNKKKAMIIVIFSAIFILYICSNCYAFSLLDVLNGGKNFENAANNTGFNNSLLPDISNSIYNILLSLAIIIDIIVGIVIGIKLMTSEAENKAEAKKSLMVFFVGSVIVYGAFGIWKVLVAFLNTI